MTPFEERVQRRLNRLDVRADSLADLRRMTFGSRGVVLTRPASRPWATLSGGRLAPSPDARNPEAIENGVNAQERHTLDMRLRGEHPIKWIPMITGQGAGPPRVDNTNGKLTKPLAGDGSAHVPGDDLKAVISSSGRGSKKVSGTLTPLLGPSITQSNSRREGRRRP